MRELNFTARQLGAVESPAQEIIAEAGAGSGKTTVLTEAIVRRIAKGKSPTDFLVVTFTRKAAAEMKRRIESRLIETGVGRSRDVADMTIGTFHAIALNYLYQFGAAIGYAPDKIVIAEPNQSEMMLRLVCRQLGYVDVRGKMSGGVKFDGLKQALQDYYTSTQGQESIFQESYASIMDAYHSRMRELNALDFGMILTEFERLMVESGTQIRDAIHRQYSDVFLDEMQDTDGTQYRLHDLVYGDRSPSVRPARMFAVGDRRQTIYSWRGASPSHVFNQYPNAEKVGLPDNFRSAVEIVEVANNLISHDPALGKIERMIGHFDGGRVDRIDGGTEDACMALIRAAADRGIPWGQCAILGRTHRELRRAEQTMRAIEGGPDVYHVGTAFSVCDEDDFVIIHSIMRAGVNPNDDLAVMSMLVAMRKDRLLEAIRDISLTTGMSYVEAWQSMPKGGDQLEDEIIGLIGEIHSVDGGDWKVSDVISACTKWMQDPQSEYAIRAFWREAPFQLVRQALRWFSLRDIQDDVPDPDAGERVTLITIHAAKGLEWDCGLILNCNEHSIPSGRSIRNDQVDEERRVLYVAITRFRWYVGLHVRTLFAEGSPKHPASRFLSEAAVV